MYTCVHVYMNIHNELCRHGPPGRGRPRSNGKGEPAPLGDSKNTVRGHCLDIPRSEESLDN